MNSEQRSRRLGLPTDMVFWFGEVRPCRSVPSSQGVDLPGTAPTDRHRYGHVDALGSARHHDISRSATGCVSQTRNLRNHAPTGRFGVSATGCVSGTRDSGNDARRRNRFQRKPFSFPHTPIHFKRNCHRSNGRPRETIDFSRNAGMGGCDQHDGGFLRRTPTYAGTDRQAGRQGEVSGSTRRGARLRLASPRRAHTAEKRIFKIRNLSEIFEHMDQQRAEKSI